MDFFHWTRQKGPLKSHGSFFKMSKAAKAIPWTDVSERGSGIERTPPVLSSSPDRQA